MSLGSAVEATTASDLAGGAIFRDVPQPTDFDPSEPLRSFPPVFGAPTSSSATGHAPLRESMTSSA